ncbi:MAG TPA: mismatch-specific DNA-glycosylase, partial [Candidatus Dormibacteraeota bacterium]|nr:mismatch-specific DNA-glycosylase [Candidatus Dormibacteraeota bacterium]
MPDPEAAILHDGEVPDVLAPGLRIVFCGINPGLRSAAAHAHFANPRNDFWRLLHDSGLTPRRLEPAEQHELPRFGLGATNAARRTTPGSADLRRADFDGARARLEAIAERL